LRFSTATISSISHYTVGVTRGPGPGEQVTQVWWRVQKRGWKRMKADLIQIEKTLIPQLGFGVALRVWREARSSLRFALWGFLRESVGERERERERESARGREWSASSSGIVGASNNGHAFGQARCR
jgi:hypothetical protein